jgi:hypothetical protein
VSFQEPAPTERSKTSTEPHQLMQALAADSDAIDAGSARLGQAIKAGETAVYNEQTGEIVSLGAKLAWEACMDECLKQVQDDMEAAARDPNNKLPATMKAKAHKVIEMEARVMAKKKYTKQWIAFTDWAAEVKALEMWLKMTERSASLRQSILSANKHTGETR